MTGATSARPRRFLADAALVFGGNLVSRGLGFLFPVVLARAAAPDDFALAYFFINSGFFVGELVLAGFPTALTRQLASPEDVPRGRWLAAAVAGGIPLLIASLAVGWVVADGAGASALLLGLVVVGLTVDAYYFAILRGLGRFGLLVGYRVAANAVQLVLLVVAVLADVVDVPLAVTIYSLVYLVPIAAIELAAGPVRGLLAGRGAIERRLVRRLAAFALPALVSGTAYAAILGFDVVLVRLLAPGELAVYGAARSLAMPMTLVSYAVGVTLLPRTAESDDATRWSLLRASLVATVGLAGAAVVAVTLLAGPVVGLVYPAAYAAAARILPAMAAAVALVGVYSVLSQWWMGRGRPIVPASCLVAGAAVAAGSGLLLIPGGGALGAAASVATGAATAIGLLGGATLRNRPAPTLRLSDGGPAAVS